MTDRTPIEGPFEHGTYNGYHNYGCRCIPCTRAHSLWTRLNHRRREEATAGQCEVEGCENGLYAKGICKAHYQRRIRGRPDYPLPKRRQLQNDGRYPSKDRVKEKV